MAARIIDPLAVTRTLREDLRREIAELSEPLTLAGFLADGHAPSITYAEYTRRGCEEVGIQFNLHSLAQGDAERAVREASSNPGIHGILVYYPVAERESDVWLREVVDPRKDIEGLHSFWARCLYENRRFVDLMGSKKAILPCTPLAILKLLAAAGVGDASRRLPLEGLRACVFNRSEVVGQPLAAMMANDGAHVTSFDLDGPRSFAPSERGHEVHASTASRGQALAEADIVVTGVPSRTFEVVRADELRSDAVCLNFSTMKNFADDVPERVAAFVPRVGPMTVTMALRNTLRLYRYTH